MAAKAKKSEVVMTETKPVIVKTDLIVGLTLTDLLNEYGILKESRVIIPHLVKLHDTGKIRLDIDTLIKNHKSDTWDRTLRINIKDLSAYGVVQLLISPMRQHTRFEEVRMIDHAIIEFWWD
jgi:hypothetical protein